MSARILLIEDNPANLELMGYLLTAHGYSIHTTTDGAAGLEAARGEPFDLIVCDVHMPTVDGYEVARQLGLDPALCATPLIAVTALAMVGDRDKVLAAGFDGYIAKPIDPERFVGQVEVLLPPEKRREAATRGMSATVSSPISPSRHTILVVDNDPINLELAFSILAPSGYRVLTGTGALDGLAVAQAHPCDLILSDVCMGELSGLDLLRMVRADPALRDIPFVFLTSTRVDESDRDAGLALGARRYLTRPIEPGALLAELDACLRESGAV